MTVTTQQERFEELVIRDLAARSLATLMETGEYDPAIHGQAAEYTAISVDEQLEILALGGILARYYLHPARVDCALTAGASFAQIADALSSDEATVRQDYEVWVDGQHRLWTTSGGKYGIDDDAYRAAVVRCSS